MRNPRNCELYGVAPHCWRFLGVHRVPRGSAAARRAHVPVVRAQHSCIPRPGNTRRFETTATLGIGRMGEMRERRPRAVITREADLMNLTASGCCSRAGRCLSSDSAFIVRPHSAPGPIPRVSKPSETLGIRRRGGGEPQSENARHQSAKNAEKGGFKDVLPPVGVAWRSVRSHRNPPGSGRPIVPRCHSQPARYMMRYAAGVSPPTAAQKYELICIILVLARYYWLQSTHLIPAVVREEVGPPHHHHHPPTTTPPSSLSKQVLSYRHLKSCPL